MASKSSVEQSGGHHVDYSGLLVGIVCSRSDISSTWILLCRLLPRLGE